MQDQRFTAEGNVFGEPRPGEHPIYAGAEQEKRPSAYELVSTLASRVSDVFAALEVLETRLDPVMRGPIQRQPPGDLEERSPMVTELQRQILALEELRISVNLITMRLEV